FKDGQTAMSIHVMQGERELVQDCRSLARFALRGIPALPAGGAPIRFTFQGASDGLRAVTPRSKWTAVAGDDADAIKEAIKNIDTQTQEFAARRMDQSVRIALKGQSVDE
ncbi:Hsp70 family protein, partial [Klebsiella pneumoniae]